MSVVNVADYGAVVNDNRDDRGAIEAAMRAAGNGGTVDAATRVGQLLAERAKAAGVEKVVFDRGGYVYHGRIAAVAEAAREAGLEF